MSYFSFKIIHQSTKSKARVGQIITPHGIIDTPNFVAVGTNGTLKALDNQMLESMEQQLMFCNTYHLLLHPGPDVVKAAGGLHKFINRNQPIITDSGGFQILSKSFLYKHNDNGIYFKNPFDGAKKFFSPEEVLIASELWDHLSGHSHTMDEIFEIITKTIEKVNRR